MSYTVEHNADRIVVNLKGYPNKVVKQVDKGAQSWIHRVTRDAKINAADATGTLKNSINVKRRGEMDYESGPGVGYGGHVEAGSGPGGVPPHQSLVDWLKVRRIIPRNDKWTLSDLAYAIQQKIKKQGVEAQPYMKPAADKNFPLLGLILKQTLSGA